MLFVQQLNRKYAKTIYLFLSLVRGAARAWLHPQLEAAAPAAPLAWLESAQPATPPALSPSSV